MEGGLCLTDSVATDCAYTNLITRLRMRRIALAIALLTRLCIHPSDCGAISASSLSAATLARLPSLHSLPPSPASSFKLCSLGFWSSEATSSTMLTITSMGSECSFSHGIRILSSRMKPRSKLIGRWAANSRLTTSSLSSTFCSTTSPPKMERRRAERSRFAMYLEAARRIAAPNAWREVSGEQGTGGEGGARGGRGGKKRGEGGCVGDVR